MNLISRLRKLEGIGQDTARAELVTLIHQSLKDSEQELEVPSAGTNRVHGQTNWSFW